MNVFPRVVFDESHSNAWSLEPEVAARINPAQSADASYALAAEALRSRGFEVVAHEQGALGEALTPGEVDRVLGQVLEAADGDFNKILEIGFLTSIHREWAWRTARGESLANLQAFAHLIDPDKLPDISPLDPTTEGLS